MMDLALPERIDRNSWRRMLSRGHEALEDEGALSAADGLMDECERMLLDIARPKGTYAFSDCISYEGKSIARHLDGCAGTVVLGMTLGRSIDERLTRLEVSDLAMGVVFDTGASLLAEAVCDLFEEKIRAEAMEKGLYMTPRFSPGYGDMPLTEQRKIISILDAEKRIGLTLTGGGLMIPLKSITAICGTADRPVKGSLATCEECALWSECEKRKAGKTCADK
ncbi:MAG: methionine synthase [Firmicutes bacterium]|nr:methionine synthase [Bacillota bacterium]